MKVKKFSTSINELNTSRKKLLDKVDLLVYNIRKGSKEKRINNMKLLKIDDCSLSVNKEATKAHLSVLEELYQHLSDAAKECDLPLPIIAGGAVRDAVLGYFRRDVDVFLLGGERNLDDEVVYFTEILRKDERFGVSRPFTKKGKTYERTQNFCTYSSNLDTSFIRDGSRMTAMDVIGRTETTPEELLTTFDHELVECYFDSSGVYISEGFFTCVKTGRIEPKTQEARKRLLHFRERTGHRIVIGRGKEKETKPLDLLGNLAWKDANDRQNEYFNEYANQVRELRHILEANGANVPPVVIGD